VSSNGIHSCQSRVVGGVCSLRRLCLCLMHPQESVDWPNILANALMETKMGNPLSVNLGLEWVDLAYTLARAL
jgi:hypothetical protein